MILVETYYVKGYVLLCVGVFIRFLGWGAGDGEESLKYCK